MMRKVACKWGIVAKSMVAATSSHSIVAKKAQNKA